MKKSSKWQITNAPIVKIEFPLFIAKHKIYSSAIPAAISTTSQNLWRHMSWKELTKSTHWVTAKITTKNCNFTVLNVQSIYATSAFRKEFTTKTWNIPFRTSVCCTRRKDNWHKIWLRNPKKSLTPWWSIWMSKERKSKTITAHPSN